MAAETKPIRDKTRRVKDHILTRYLKIADKVDAGETFTDAEDKFYSEMTSKFAPNCVPRSQEITGEEGASIQITFDSAFKNNGTPQQTEGDSSVPSEI